MRAYLAACCLLAAAPAAAQSLTILSSNATRALIEELGPQFEKASGATLTLTFANSAALKARIEKGEAFDVAVMTASLIAELAMSKHVDAATRVNIARTGIGMAIHPAAARPDISSLDALKGALLRSQSVTYVEQGATAPVMRSIFAKLGLAEQMNAKTVYSDSAAHAVADKQAELGFTQISEILNVPGATLAAPLPPEVQVYTTFAAAASTKAASNDAVRRFIAFISGAQAAATIEQKGMEVIPPDRLPPIPQARLTPAQQEAVAAFKTARGAASRQGRDRRHLRARRAGLR